MKNLEHIRGSRVYGRRQGPVLSAARQARFDKGMPELSIILPDGTAAPQTYFSTAHKDHWLEIGFGKGEHLAQQAQANPAIAMIGCEPYLGGVSGLVDQVDALNLTNIRIFTDDARLLMDSLPDQTIGRAFILFPDPWPKARHHKRRIVSTGNINSLARILKDGAELRIATDHREYCRWIMGHMLSSEDFIWSCERVENGQSRPSDWPISRYEQKSRNAGRKPVYLRFIRRPRRQ